MKWIVAILGAIAASATLALAASNGHTAARSAASANVAERAFVRWLAKHHPGFQGPSVCPSSRSARAANGGIRCVAEIHKGRRYIQVWGIASPGAKVTFKRQAAIPWTRRWSKYSRPPQHVSPGLISVNATGSFDWRWLVLGVDYECRQKHRESCTSGALDGQWAGYGLFFTFDCHTQGNLITCRNKLGDALRWLPNATQPRVTFRHATFYVRPGVSFPSLLHGVLGVGSGSTAAHVRNAFGTPLSRSKLGQAGRTLTCWFYRAEQPSSSLDGLGFCLSRRHRVQRLMLAMHG